MTPIRFIPTVTPSTIAMVVARTECRCTRLQARAYLEACHGDVACAVGAWQDDHNHWGERAAYERVMAPMEASE